MRICASCFNHYGQTDTLVKFLAYHADLPLLLADTFEIDVPAEKPRVASVTHTNYTDRYVMTLFFKTRLLEDGANYDFAVSSSSHSHSAVLTTTVSGKGDSQEATVTVDLNVDGTGELYNNATYTLNLVTKMTPKGTPNDETEILIENITFKTPIIAPFISDVSVRMDTAGGERYAIVRLEGRNISTTAYAYVYFGDTALVSHLTANTSTWFEFYQYTITKVTNEFNCVLLRTLRFTVPEEKPRLASASVTDSSDHLSCTIMFTTRLLENGASYLISMIGSPTSGTGPEHTGVVTATPFLEAHKQQTVATARLSEDGKNADLINGCTYVPTEVVKVHGTTEANIIIDNFDVRTGPAAPKVTSVKTYFISNSFERNLTIVFRGSQFRGLSSQIALRDSQRQSDEVAASIGVRKEGLLFTVPQENPRLLSVSSQTNASDATSTTLTFETSKLEDGETDEITLSGTSTTSHTAILRVVASTTRGIQTATGTAILSPPEEASLWHGMTYTPILMKKVNSENEHTSIVIHEMSFETASDNRKVSLCGVGFTDHSKRSLKIRLGGTNLPTDSLFFVTIDATTPFDLNASGVFSSTSEGSILASTFLKGQAPDLEYGKTYKIKSMRYDVRITSITKTVFNEHINALSVTFATSEDDKADCLIFGQSYIVEMDGGVDEEESMPVFDDVSFKLKHTPKITHVDCTYTNKMGMKAQLTLSGTGFPDNEVLTATLTGGITFTVTCSDDDTAVSEPIVIGLEKLKYETENAFVSLTRMFDVSSSHFVADARPALSVFVVKEGDEEGKDCREESKPCGLMRKVIELSVELRMKNILQVLLSATLHSPSSSPAQILVQHVHAPLISQPIHN
ncbi:hypothetical protein BLNAU_12403 [Blattamonas nauphoetae]|uniref:Uncharacterized protein n=1 Tax=Blattamonas nauphoetae TaxID=2049346 RepID=A0ABQ9XMY5_9EUKA|nr:hypothetical protein BLNAU_12403 [Blattamonas nauphoetae]